jgi:hypothetical protein
MLRDSASLRAELRHDEDHPEVRGVPAPLGQDEGRHHPPLDVDRMQRRLNVADFALDLDDQQGLGPGMPGQDVHGPSIGEVVERPLRGRLPAQAPQLRHDRLYQRCMAPIDLAIHSGAPERSGCKGQLDLQDRRHGTNPGNCHQIEPAVFDPPHRLGADSGQGSHVRLPQPASLPLGSDPGADSQIVHKSRMAGAD